MKRIAVVVVVVVFAMGVGVLVLGQDMKPTPDHGFFGPSDIKWVDGPASLASGARMAILEGNPSQAGPFTMRLNLPDGFIIPPHWHPAIEHVTVISGTLNLGMGEKFDKSAGRAFTVGSFAFMPAGMRHFAWATGETVVQVHGIGPWQINYVNSADDPRNKK
jgi:quercetin dioxygenase-like cupin family protein